ncbi:TRAP transporter small permease [Sedimenticola thiotaurini]|uniref:TRAP transporter small permease protein n=1 Tax=Sedimenticola thiotaurini TaxID=1543721 RepID=A0A0F7JRF1_9GAMM|nr:TRAP transporter small permease subunit [Sedimenticola thiotaurini]AKH19026.1 C4-dicarboxylate ABC transporter permease [Sedimenticola thiotaurini]
MRRLLDRLYLTAAAVAGLCLVLMALLILVQIVGRWFGVVVPSTEDFSGFLLAAASFLALAYTLRSGGHIRVSLVISHLHGRSRRLMEGVVLLLALVLVGYAAWSASQLVLESYRFQEVSQGYIPVLLWIPQLPMAVGLLVLEIALLDEWVLLLRGDQPRYMRHDESAVGPGMGK